MPKTIKVDALSRVEGEGGLTIRFRRNKPADVELNIFEPPRFFEGFLKGRDQTEMPDLTARICGICPVAYQMSACRAIENAHGIAVSEAVKELRRLLYCGEWIESHVLHMYLLHAPDFLGFDDIVAMAKDHEDLVQRGLRMKKAGNAIVALLGGREIHPVNVKVGGFYRLPGTRELATLVPELEWARSAAIETADDFARFSYPTFERDYEFVALRDDNRYPFCEGRLVSSKGLDIGVEEYDDWFIEEHFARSTALHSRIKNRGEYFCGPLARINLNFDLLRAPALEAAHRIGFAPPCSNPFKSILARAIEVVNVIDEALDIIARFSPASEPDVPVPARTATGFGITEAPRGILYHRYTLDDQGLVTTAKIVPPTAQNQACIEADLRAMAARLAAMPHAAATWLAEQTVRNYDPCISCSTHFLRLSIEDES